MKAKKSLRVSIETKTLAYNGMRAKFKKPIIVKLFWQSKHWWHEYLDLNILSYGLKVEESWEKFSAEFFFLWKEFVQKDDTDLTLDAREVKQKLLSLVECVKEHNIVVWPIRKSDKTEKEASLCS
jgi:hypothetical protein